MTLDRQPHLSGDLLELRPITAGDFEALYAVASDPLVWEQHPSKDRSERDVFRAWFDDAMDSGGTLVVLDRSDGSVIGSSRYHGYDEERSEVEIGWTFLARSHWGGVFNGELKRLMLDHAFRTVATVVFKVHIDNARSRRAVEKLGAALTGTEDDPLGRGTNVIYELRRPDGG